MATVSIPETFEEKKVTFYAIQISLPLRSITVSRRYSDFCTLTDTLCRELGINNKDFPYPLPPKGGVFHSKATVVADRQVRLAAFLNNVIRDRELQNRTSVHRFLDLPINFRFTAEHFRGTTEKDFDKIAVLDADESSIDGVQWLSYLRQLRATISGLPQNTNLETQVEVRNNMNTYIRPGLAKLASSLQALSKSGAFSQSELSKRTSLLEQLEVEAERKCSRGPSQSQSVLREELDISGGPPQETNTTMALNNHQLLQQQQLVHRQQDEELEQLRMIIGRQKQIGEAINREVEEQNEMLDEFVAEVETSSHKLKNARTKARQIG